MFPWLFWFPEMCWCLSVDIQPWPMMGRFMHSSTPDFCWPHEILAFQSSIRDHSHCHNFLFSFCSRFRELCSRKLQNHRNSLSTNLWIYASKQPQQDPRAARTSFQSHPFGSFLETPERWTWTFTFLDFSIPPIPMAPLAGLSSFS